MVRLTLGRSIGRFCFYICRILESLRKCCTSRLRRGRWAAPDRSSSLGPVGRTNGKTKRLARERLVLLLI